VPHQNEIDAGAPQLVDKDEDFAAGQSKDALDAGIGDGSCGYSGSGRHAVVR
jgi:hypothetical protein